jgi:hypothetical protein
MARKGCLGWFFVPKGQEDSAQGFNPGNRTSPAKSPERAPDRMVHSTHLTKSALSPLQHLQPGGPGVFPRTHIHVPCEGESPYLMVPRLKPSAKLFSPFGFGAGPSGTQENP